MVKVKALSMKLKKRGKRMVMEIVLDVKVDEAWWGKLKEVRKQVSHKGLNTPSLTGKGKVLRVPCVGEDELGQRDYGPYFERVKRDWIEEANKEKIGS